MELLLQVLGTDSSTERWSRGQVCGLSGSWHALMPSCSQKNDLPACQTSLEVHEFQWSGRNYLFPPPSFLPFWCVSVKVKVSDVSQGEQWLEMKLQVLCSPHWGGDGPEHPVPPGQAGSCAITASTELDSAWWFTAHGAAVFMGWNFCFLMEETVFRNYSSSQTEWVWFYIINYVWIDVPIDSMLFLGTDSRVLPWNVYFLSVALTYQETAVSWDPTEWFCENTHISVCFFPLPFLLLLKLKWLCRKAP